jgi:hypothetical protein
MTSNALPSNITHMAARNLKLQSQGLAFYLNTAQCPCDPVEPCPT